MTAARIDVPQTVGATVSARRHYQSPIRDLMLQLDQVAQNHIAYPQVADAMSHLRNHLSAIARCEEVNREEPR